VEGSREVVSVGRPLPGFEVQVLDELGYELPERRVGRVFVRDGRFFRRERGYRLNLVEATNVHLPRAVRAALRGEI